MADGSIRNRVMTIMFVIYGLVAIMLIVVLVKVVSLKFGDPKDWQSQMASIDYRDYEAHRGDIYSSDGRILATSIPSYSVHWDLSVRGLDTLFNKYVDTLACCMSKLFGDMSKDEYIKKFKDGRAAKSTFFPIRNRVTHSQVMAMRKFPIFKKGRYSSGLICTLEYRREKPHNTLAARTIGLLSTGDKANTVGMEGAFDKLLSGKTGRKLSEKISSGDWVPINNFPNPDDVEPVDGFDIISTIDMNLQDIVDRSLSNQLTKYKAKDGCVVVMEVRTGKIRAISNLDRSESGKISEILNYAVGRASEPGSTIKLASLIACLESGEIDISDSIDLGSGTITFPNGHTIRDDHKMPGYHTVREIFESSSNVGFAKMAIKVFGNNPREFVDRLYNMHLNKLTGIELIGEAKPYFNYPQEHTWSSISLPQMAYGYESQLTPLQILTFYNAIANGGKMVKPHLLESVRSHGETIDISTPEILNSAICSKETLDKVQLLLRGVVEKGTAKSIRSDNYSIAGKTGTAMIALDNKGYKSDDGVKYRASFVGYFPAEKPKYSIIVVINSPSIGSYYASAVACPVFKEIADKLFSKDRDLHSKVTFDVMKFPETAEKKALPKTKVGDREILDRLYSTFNIQVDNIAKSTYVVSTPNGKVMHLEERSSEKKVVPEVRGMGLRDAMTLLRHNNLQVSVSGRGVVVKQSIPSGTTVTKNMKIVIELG